MFPSNVLFCINLYEISENNRAKQKYINKTYNHFTPKTSILILYHNKQTQTMLKANIYIQI